MTRFKKALALLLTFALCLGLLACGKQADEPSSEPAARPGLAEAVAGATQETQNLVKLCKV